MVFGWLRRLWPAPRGGRPGSADDPGVRRALDLLRRKDYQGALRQVDAMLQEHPDVAMSWRFRGECLFYLQRYDEAAEAFATAARLGGPGTEEMFLWQALSLVNAGKRSEGMELVRSFLAFGNGAPELVHKARTALETFERDAETQQ